MIALRTWYKILLFMPLYLPVILFLLLWLAIGNPYKPYTGDNPFELAIASITLFLGAALFYTGAQYIFFTIGLLWFLRSKETHYWHKFSWIAPLIFMPVCGLGWFIFEPKISVFSVALLSIPFGYFYVFLAHGLTWLAKKAHLVRFNI